MGPLRATAAVLLLGLTITGCSRQKQLSHQDVQSYFKTAISYASQTELFLDLIQNQAVTRIFAEHHSADLRKEIEQTLEQLSAPTVVPRDDSAKRLLQAQLSLLARLLLEISKPAASDTVSAVKSQVGRVRGALECAQAAL